MSAELSADMAMFLWMVISEPVIASIASAAALTVAILIASYFNFLLTKEGQLQS